MLNANPALQHASALDTQEIEAVLQHENISVFFQPVVSVRAKGIIGFEAFSRSTSTSGARLDALDLFGQDWDPEIRLKLCRLCRRKALEAFRPIFERHPQMLLFLNTDGRALAASATPGHLDSMAQSMRIPGKRIVIELERPCLGMPEVARFAAYYRERGFSLSVDVGGGMDLPAEEIFALRPDFIKFDRALFADAEAPDIRSDMVRALGRLGDRLGCVVLAKNVEDEKEALRLLEWGVSYQQGFFYTKEKDAGERDPIRAFQHKVEELNRRYRERAQAGIATRRKRYEGFHKVLGKASYKLADSPEASFSAACERLAAGEDLVVCAYVLSEDGTQITPRCFKRSLAPETPLLGPERGRGADHGLRDDVLHLKSGFDKYVLPEQVSPHAKVPISVISERFYNSEGQPYILCLEFFCG